MNLFTLLCILSYSIYVSCQSACNSQKTCGTCIGHASERCVWCLQKTVSVKCQPEKYPTTNKDWCEAGSIYNPQNVTEEIKNAKFSSSVQFRPQLIKIKARPGVEVNFNMSYKPADDFPLDVYFVMDYSFTMKKHKEALEKQALDIYRGLRLLTKNVRLGVGSFVEKPGLPYADFTKHYSYAFKNHLPLTNDMDRFEREIKNSNFGGNYDNPEAGLDALMQTMKCEKQLGWRNESRRIIVLATDSTYHSAGDGKMVGAIKPNDMECHLDIEGKTYKEDLALTYDYPSVSQINKVAANGKFKIIFAALSKMKDVYEALAKQILGAKYAVLEEEKSNIVDIIKAAYEESVKHVELNHDAQSPIQLDIVQDCNANPPINCESSPAKPYVTIPASIKSTEYCRNPGATNYTITINPVGLSDKLTIIFEVDCQCECEKNSIKSLSDECSLAGIMECGACKCNKDRGGNACQYKCTDELANNFTTCLQTADAKICNSHGTCRCGKCDCQENFSGEFCQYDDTSCPSKNGLLCAGNGECKYAKCDCRTHWTGAGCDCPDHDRDCFGAFSAKVCSGRGTCDCGVCICNKVGNTNETYLGTFCDSCDECAIERCNDLKDYATCNHNEEKHVCDKKFNDTADIDVILKNETELMNMSEWKMATKCRTELEDGTFLLFKYKASSKTRRLLLLIQKEVEQPPTANIWVAAGSSIAGILLIGLLTAVIWKILIDKYDKREYNKFCDEAREQGYDVSLNPVYQPPTQNWVNPTFRAEE